MISIISYIIYYYLLLVILHKHKFLLYYVSFSIQCILYITYILNRLIDVLTSHRAYDMMFIVAVWIFGELTNVDFIYGIWLFISNNSCSVVIKYTRANTVTERFQKTEVLGYINLLSNTVKYIDVVQILLLNNSIQSYLHIKYRDVERSLSRRSARDSGRYWR